MRTRLLAIIALPAIMLTILALRGWAEEKGDPKDKEAIAKNAEAFIEAFQKGDAKALAAFWTPDGDYTDQKGVQLKGREAIEKAFTKLFSEHKDLKLRIESEALRFVTPDVAIEDGQTAVITPDGAPASRARYTIVHVKKNEQWLLSSVRDAAYVPPSNHEHLSALEWAIGDWANDGETGHKEKLSFAWTETQNFIVANFSTDVKDVPVGAATFWIGWDPIAKNIRSWMFDADGGFGDNTWTRDGKKWTIKTTGVLRDGKKLAATYVIGPVDADTITLQSKERSVDGKELPDTKEIKLKRVK